MGSVECNRQKEGKGAENAIFCSRYNYCSHKLMTAAAVCQRCVCTKMVLSKVMHEWRMGSTAPNFYILNVGYNRFRGKGVAFSRAFAGDPHKAPKDSPSPVVHRGDLIKLNGCKTK